MIVEFRPDFPVTDAACKKVTGKTLKDWFKLLDGRGGTGQKRRDAVNWLYDEMNKDAWWSTTVWVAYEAANKVVKKDGLAEGYNICSTKTIAAPVADVYNAFVDQTLLRKWFGGKATAKVSEGGSFDDKDGNTGEYLRIRKDKDLRFTWNNPKALAPTQVDVAFADKGKGKTGITLNHQRIQNRDEADGLRKAWGDALTTLKGVLES